MKQCRQIYLICFFHSVLYLNCLGGMKAIYKYIYIYFVFECVYVCNNEWLATFERENLFLCTNFFLEYNNNISADRFSLILFFLFDYHDGEIFN